MKTPKRPVTLMIVAQVICILAVPLTLQFVPLFAVPNLVVMQNLHLADSTVWLPALRDFAIGGLLIWVEIEAFCICGRVRKSSAFSAKNEKALGLIAQALGMAGVLTLLFGDSLIPFLLTGLPAIAPVVERLLLPFTLLVIALMIRAVQLLMRRALTMQEETDLTV